MTDTIYLTFNDLNEDTQLEIYNTAMSEVFNILKNEFIDNYGIYINDTHIENTNDLAEAVATANKNLTKQMEKDKEKDNEDYEDEVVEIGGIVFDSFDKNKIRNDLENLVNEETDNMICNFNYVFNI